MLARTNDGICSNKRDLEAQLPGECANVSFAQETRTKLHVDTKRPVVGQSRRGCLKRIPVAIL